jgi:hypothetical protein
VDPSQKGRLLMADSRGYYNLLARGFLKGELSLDAPVDPALAQMKNPYDPGERAGRGLHDASYYKGKYYLYFGLTPALVLFVPVKVLTGQFVDESTASLIFSLAGFGAAVALLHRIRRRWLADTPEWQWLLGVLVLGVGTMVPALLRRPGVWEAPISCAYALFMLTLFCVWRSLTSRHPAVWLAAASVAMGWCIGARPTYLPGAVVLLVPLVALARKPFAPVGRWWRLGLAAIGPIAAVGMVLAAYNFFRFGSILDFGWTYQMAGDDISAGKLFSFGVMAFNLRLYLFAPAGLSPFFPFVTVASLPPVPAGQIGIENAYGLLPNLPWVALAGVPWFARGKGTGGILRWYWAGTFLASAGILLLLCTFRGAAGRYEVDFSAGWILLAAVGALALRTRATGLWRRATAGMVLLLGVWSVLFGVLVSLQHNELLRAEHPEVYRRVAHASNWPAYWLDRLLGAKYGAVELKVVFPRGAAGQNEALVTTGHAFLADYVYVHYLDDETVQFGFEHTSRGGALGAPAKIAPGATHLLRIDMGSLYPPPAHPWFDRFPREDVRRMTRTLRVTLDGTVVLQRTLEFYDAAERRPGIGTAGERPGFRRDFSGQLLSWRRLAEDPPKAVEVQWGRLRLRLRFPPFTQRSSEPLLSSGESGKGDLIFVTYEDAGHVSFGNDHWAVGGTTSPKIEITPGTEHILEISCPPLLGPDAPAGLTLTLDGREAFVTPAAFYPTSPDTVAVGVNLIQASSARMTFTGDILSVERLSP